MTNKKLILCGAFLLTAAGILGRIMGFFYKIFLSRAIGAEGLGIYQLVFPLYALAHSLTSGGIQTSISRFVSSRTASGDHKGARSVLLVGICMSLSLSLPVSALLLCFHDSLAIHFVKEVRTSRLLMLLAYAIPFGSLHACIDGYFFGLRQAKIPAAGQILEQFTRILSFFLLVSFFQANHIALTPSLAIYVIISQEIVVSLFSACAGHIHFKHQPDSDAPRQPLSFYCREMIRFSLPLTLNRVFMNVLQSIEALLIPIQLQVYGMTVSESLSLYGVLTGMAMPLILFPTAVTSAVSTLLLPTVSEAQAENRREAILRILRITCGCCLALGCGCWLFFLATGHFLGNLLFNTPMAGTFIVSLAWICPLLYLNPALFAILNGLGLTGTVFLHNTLGALIRIAFVIFGVPRFGISAIFWGMMIHQIYSFCQSIRTITKWISKV